MNTEQVAKKVVELVRKQAWYEALMLYDDNVVSVEAFSMGGGSPEKSGPARVTVPVLQVIDLLLAEPSRDDWFALEICRQTGLGSGTVAQQEYDKAVADVRSGKARVIKSERALTMLLEGPRKEQIEAANALLRETIVTLPQSLGVDNASIDADLAREYGDDHRDL